MKKIPRIMCILVLLSIIWLPSAHAKSPPAPNSQIGTFTFDQSNSQMGCVVHSFISRADAGEHELSMILLTSTSYMDTNPSQFNYTFNFDQGTITGNLTGSYYADEEADAYDSSDIFATISNGTVTWDPAQGVWVFGGDVNIEAYLDMMNKIGSAGDEIYYGEAHVNTNVTAQIIGASGEHKRLDHHGELQTYDDEFRIVYEGKDIPSEGAGEISMLNIECWLETPLREAIGNFFPAGPVSGATESETGGDAQPTEVANAQTQTDAEVANEGEFLGMDLNDQLGLFIATYGTDWEMLNQWPGWDALNDTQKLNLINLIERLDHILALQAPVSPMGLALLEDEKRQEIIAQQAADLVEDELDVRKNIRDTVWTETLRDKFGDKAVYLYQNYQILKDVKSVYDAGAGWINNIKDADTAAIEKLKQDAMNSAGANKTPEDLAYEAIQHINTIATESSIYHYAYYRQVYDSMIADQKTPDEAHQIAMDALRKRVNDYAIGEFGDPNNKLDQYVWGPGVNAALEDNGIYDHAFPHLNDKAAPQVTP